MSSLNFWGTITPHTHIRTVQLLSLLLLSFAASAPVQETHELMSLSSYMLEWSSEPSKVIYPWPSRVNVMPMYVSECSHTALYWKVTGLPLSFLGLTAPSFSQVTLCRNVTSDHMGPAFNKKVCVSSPGAKKLKCAVAVLQDILIINARLLLETTLFGINTTI